MALSRRLTFFFSTLVLVVVLLCTWENFGVAGDEFESTTKTEKQVESAASSHADIGQLQQQLHEANSECEAKLSSAVTAIQKDLRVSQQALTNCNEDRVSTNSRLSECLAQASKFSSTQQELNVCRAALDDNKASWASSEKTMLERIRTLEEQRNQVDASCSAEKTELKLKLSSCAKDLAASETVQLELQHLLGAARKQAAENVPHIYSVHQFYSTLEKLGRLTRAVATDIWLFINRKVNLQLLIVNRYHQITSDVSKRWTTATATLHALMKEKQLDRYWTSVVSISSTALRISMGLWSQHGTPVVTAVVDQAERKLAPLLTEYKALLRAYLFEAHRYLNDVVINPFKERHPAVVELIPSASIDQLFTIGYLIVIGRVICWMIFRVLRLLMTIVCFVCCSRCSRRSRHSHHSKRKGESNRAAKRDAPQIPPSTGQTTSARLKPNTTMFPQSGSSDTGNLHNNGASRHRSSRHRGSPK